MSEISYSFKAFNLSLGDDQYINVNNVPDSTNVDVVLEKVKELFLDENIKEIISII